MKVDFCQKSFEFAIVISSIPRSACHFSIFRNHRPQIVATAVAKKEKKKKDPVKEGNSVPKLSNILDIKTGEPRKDETEKLASFPDYLSPVFS